MEISKRHSSDFTRVFDLLAYQRAKYPNAKALNAVVDETWISYSIEEIQQRADALSCWFLEMGYKQGEKVMLVPQAGNPQWMIIDFACQQVGLIVVPVHPTSNDDEIEIIFTETEARLCIAADLQLCTKFSQVNSKIGSPAKLFHLERGTDNYFSPIDIDHYMNNYYSVARQNG